MTASVVMLISCRDQGIGRVELPDGTSIEIERICTEPVQGTMVDPSQTVNCAIGTRMTVPIGKKVIPTPSDVDARKTNLDFSRSNVGLPPQMTVSLKMLNNNLGTIASRNFTLANTGGVYSFIDPDGMEVWMVQHSGAARGISMDSLPFQITPVTGENRVIAEGKFDNIVVASKGQIWTQSECTEQFCSAGND